MKNAAEYQVMLGFLQKDMAILKIKLEGSSKNKFGFGVKAIIHHQNKLQVVEKTSQIARY